MPIRPASERKGGGMVPHADRGGCGAREHLLGGSVRALTVENDLLAATILPDKGADFYGLIYKPRGVDVLWKTPWALRALGRGVQSARESMAAWLDAYPGGWQTLFPSGGGPCTYKGVELNFHGEASMCAWDHEVRVAERDRVEVFLHTRLSRSPFRIERTVSLQAGHAALAIRDSITNEGGEDMDYMWGHHPAFGAPFLGPACRIDLGARAVHADDQFDGPWNPLAPATDCPWPLATRDGVSTDLSRVPGPDSPRHSLAYLSFEQGWYAITNCDLGFGVGL